jgi:hypothetical protein
MHARKHRGMGQKMYVISVEKEEDSIWKLRIEGNNARKYDIAFNLCGSLNATCSCPDFLKRRMRCKHIYFILYRILGETLSCDELSDEMSDKLHRLSNGLRIHPRSELSKLQNPNLPLHTHFRGSKFDDSDSDISDEWDKQLHDDLKEDAYDLPGSIHDVAKINVDGLPRRDIRDLNVKLFVPLFESDVFYQGTVVTLFGDEAVEFSYDPDHPTVILRLSDLHVRVGSFNENHMEYFCNFRGEETYFQGIIEKFNNDDTVAFSYYDGDYEKSVSKDRLCIGFRKCIQ